MPPIGNSNTASIYLGDVYFFKLGAKQYNRFYYNTGEVRVMGMFDELRCEYPLPDAAMQDEVFQTKSFHCEMDRHTITADGRLIHHMTRWESVPEEERPHYGKPEWDKPLYQIFGAIKTVPMGDVEIPFHGDVDFYTSHGEPNAESFEWFEYQARFTDGRLQWIRRVEREQRR